MLGLCGDEPKILDQNLLGIFRETLESMYWKGLPRFRVENSSAIPEERRLERPQNSSEAFFNWTFSRNCSNDEIIMKKTYRGGVLHARYGNFFLVLISLLAG